MNSVFKRSYGEVSTQEWFWTLLALHIPFLNIILVLYWGLSDSANPSKRNLCRAILLWVVVAICAAVFFIMLGLLLNK